MYMYVHMFKPYLETGLFLTSPQRVLDGMGGWKVSPLHNLFIIQQIAM